MSLTRRRCQKRNVQWGKSGKRRVIFFLLIDSKSTLLPLNLLPFTEPALLPLNLPLLLSLSRAAQLLTAATSLHWVHGLAQHAWPNHGNRRIQSSCCKLPFGFEGDFGQDVKHLEWISTGDLWVVLNFSCAWLSEVLCFTVISWELGVRLRNHVRTVTWIHDKLTLAL